MDLPNWISAISAAATVIGAIFSWCYKKLSKKAKLEAEEASEQAKKAELSAAKTLEIAEQKLATLNEILEEQKKRNIYSEAQANAVHSIDKSLKPHPTITRIKNNIYSINNPGDEELIVTKIVNREEAKTLRICDNFSIPPHGRKDFRVIRAHQAQPPENLILEVKGQEEYLYISMPD